MSRIFLSHSSADELEAVALAHWLAHNGWDDVFLDVDAERGLVPGERWQQALRRAADRCEAVLFVVSPAWAKSKWCLAEFLLAKSLNKLIFGVVLKEVSISELPAEMTSEWQLCHLAGQGPVETIRFTHREQAAEVSFLIDGLKRLRGGLQASGLNAETFPWPPVSDAARSPYRGLEPLDVQDAAVFFGRDAEILQALDKLRGMRAAGDEGLFVILAASGAGKSSFLRAGLLPRLTRDQRHFWPLPVVRPERRPLSGERGLAAALAKAQSDLTSVPVNPGDVKTTLGENPAHFHALLRTLQSAAQSRLPSVPDDAMPPTLLLPIDQAEELFNADALEETRVVLQLIGGTLRESIDGREPNRRVPLIVVFTIRSDRFEPLQTAPELAGLKTVIFDALRPMPPAQFKEVIVGPAHRAGRAGRRVDFKPDLVAKLLEDCARGADTLPLLSLTLVRLYNDYGADGDLRLDEYLRMGGMADVIHTEAESILSADPEIRSGQLALLHAAFIPWLATINEEDDQPIRRIARFSDLPEASRPLVQALIEKRLLLSDVQGGDPVVEVAHESLLRQWKTLVEWLRVERDDLKEADRIEHAAAAWSRTGAKADWLFEGERLTIAETLAAKPAYRRRLERIAEFLVASRHREEERRAEGARVRQAELDTAHEKQLAAEALASEQARAAAQARADAARLRTRGRQVLFAAAFVVGLAVVAAVFAVRANRQSTLAQRQFVEATALRVNSEAQAMLAGTRAGGQVIGFLKLLAAHRLAPHREIEGAMSAQITAFGALDKIVDTGSRADAVAVSPDGTRIVSTDANRALRMWNAITGLPVGPPFVGHQDLVTGIAFGQDGRTVLSSSYDDTIRVWDATTAHLVRTIKAHQKLVFGAAFSPDGSRIASAGKDQTLRIWSASSGEAIGQPLIGHRDSVDAIAFSQDGTRIVTGGGPNDRTLRVWNAMTGELIGPAMNGHQSAVESVAFDRSGTRIVSGSLDQTVRLWDVATLQPIGEPLRGHTDWIQRVAFSPDGARIVSASDDETIRIWNAKDGSLIGAPLRHQGHVKDVAFSADGARVVSASSDRTLRIWWAGSRRHVIETGAGELGCFVRVAAAPDTQQIISGGDCTGLQLWDTSGKRLVDAETQDSRSVAMIAVSPEGTRFVTAGTDGAVRLWDRATLRQIGAPMTGHQKRVFAVAFSHDGKLVVSGGEDQTVRLWDATKGEAIGAPMIGHHDGIIGVAFTPDGTQIVSGSREGVLRTWNTKTGQSIAAFSIGVYIDSLALSPDGTAVALGCADGAVRMWDAQTRQLVGTSMTGQGGDVRAVAYSGDGSRIVSGHGDGTLHLWDAGSGQPIGPPLRGHEGTITSVTFTRDDTHIISGSDDTTIRIWPAPKAWPDTLCAKLSVNLSHRQWREWVSPDIEYRVQCPGLPVPPDDPAAAP